MINEINYKDIVSTLRDISDQASKKILEIYNSNFKINIKNDNSPLLMLTPSPIELFAVD